MSQGGGLEETVIQVNLLTLSDVVIIYNASTYLVTNLFSHLPTRCIHYTKVREGVITLGSFSLVSITIP